MYRQKNDRALLVKKMENTSLRICDIKQTIDSMCPISIYLNGVEVWNDDKNDNEQYENILGQTDLVIFLIFEVVQFHHSVVYIRTK
jgi:hypothetical protein